MFVKITFKVVHKCELPKINQTKPNFLDLIARNFDEKGMISKTNNQENTKKLTIFTLNIVLVPFTELTFVRDICQ